MIKRFEIILRNPAGKSEVRIDGKLLEGVRRVQIDTPDMNKVPVIKIYMIADKTEVKGEAEIEIVEEKYVEENRTKTTFTTVTKFAKRIYNRLIGLEKASSAFPW